MKRLVNGLITTLFFCSAWGTALADTAAIIVPQEQTPVQVYEYQTDFDSKGDEKFWVEHTVRYKNISGKKVVAVRLGVMELGVFGELLGGSYWQIVEKSSADEKEKVVINHESAEAPFFKGYGSGLVWVDAVRYEDGGVWQLDRAKLLEELKKTRPEMTEQTLLLKKNIYTP